MFKVAFTALILGAASTATFAQNLETDGGKLGYAIG